MCSAAVFSEILKLLTHLFECCICASVNQESIGSDNGLSPNPQQAII